MIEKLGQVALLLSALAACGGDAAKLPTLSECIAGFELDWPNVSKERYDIQNEFHLPLGVPVDARPSAFQIQNDGDQIYFAFTKDCERRYEFAENIFEYWREKGIEVPPATAITGVIEPKLSTICVRGPAWRDGCR